MLPINQNRIVRWIAIAALCLGLAAPAQAATTLKIATVSPDGTTWMRLMREAAEEIDQRTHGQVKFKFYPGGIMGNDESVLRKMRIGQLHGGAITGGSLGNVSPDNQIYSLPFLFRSLAEVTHVRGTMDAMIMNVMEEKGFVSFGLAEAGFAYLMSQVPVRTLEVLQAQRVWVPLIDGISRDAMQRASISPIPLPLPDVLTGLQTGLVNTVTTSPIAAIALQWHTRVKYLTETPLSYVYATLIVDTRAFRKISSDHQKIVRAVMGKAFVEIDAKNRQDNVQALTALGTQGIEFVQFETDSLKRIRAAADAVRSDISASGRSQQKLLDELKRTLAEFRQSDVSKSAKLSR
jgi:TRAP-type C4-dicarboxylate transport system substrate-binding protein